MRERRGSSHIGRPSGEQWYRTRIAKGHALEHFKGHLLPVLAEDAAIPVVHDADYPDSLDPFYEVEASLRRENMLRAIESLPEREKQILKLRFGFDDEPWTIEAIGLELGLTRERVRQLEGQALSRLARIRELAEA